MKRYKEYVVHGIRIALLLFFMAPFPAFASRPAGG
jgi:hypothetical protein